MTFRIRACLNGKPLPPHEDKKEKGWVYKTRAAAERRKKELDDYARQRNPILATRNVVLTYIIVEEVAV